MRFKKLWAGLTAFLLSHAAYQPNRIEDALYDTFGGQASGPRTSLTRIRDSTDLPRTVIDIDLPAVFKHMDSTRIAMVGARYEGAWNNEQLAEEAAWLSELFHPDMVWANMVAPSFVLLSKHRPAHVDTSAWPGWMVPKGAPLSMRLR